MAVLQLPESASKPEKGTFCFLVNPAGENHKSKLKKLKTNPFTVAMRRRTKTIPEQKILGQKKNKKIFVSGFTLCNRFKSMKMNSFS
jgi:hypothetical protein